MAKKIGIPCEFRCELAMTAWATSIKGFMYVVRERHGAAEALACIERFFEMDDRMKNLTNFIKKVFKIEGNDLESAEKWYETYLEIIGSEFKTLERSKTLWRNKVTKCIFKTGYKDLSEWCIIWNKFVLETLNPKFTAETIKQMCAGDPYCEFATKLEG